MIPPHICFKWNDNTVVASAAKEDEKDKIRVNSEDDSTLKAPESEGSQIEVNNINDVKLSKDKADPIETVSDLEKSDNGSNLIHKSDDNEKERVLRHLSTFRETENLMMHKLRSLSTWKACLIFPT
jgi:hypothetical protein